MKLCDIKPLDAGQNPVLEYKADLPNKHVDVIALDGNLGEDPLPMGIELKLSLIADAGKKVLNADNINDKIDQLAMLVQLTTITLMSDIEQLPKRLTGTIVQEECQ